MGIIHSLHFTVAKLIRANVMEEHSVMASLSQMMSQDGVSFVLGCIYFSCSDRDTINSDFHVSFSLYQAVQGERGGSLPSRPSFCLPEVCISSRASSAQQLPLKAPLKDRVRPQLIIPVPSPMLLG